MIAAIRAAIKYKDLLPIFLDLITDVPASVKDDGKITKKEQSRLMKKFHALVKAAKEAK